MSERVGYARVLTRDQNLDSQKNGQGPKSNRWTHQDGQEKA